MKRTSFTTAFTLVELMVSTAVLAILVAILVQTTNEAGNMWRRSSGKIEQFSEARRGFDRMTRLLAEATLNTYWDYKYNRDPKSVTLPGQPLPYPMEYIRQSELRFRSGMLTDATYGILKAKTNGVARLTHGVFFQAPAGVVDDPQNMPLDQSLNTWGFFTEVALSSTVPPVLNKVVPLHRRSRLMELREPTERLSIYDKPTGSADTERKKNWWYADSILATGDRPVRVLAENIIALVVLPKLTPQDEKARQDAAGGRAQPAMCPNYEYDSDRTSMYPVGSKVAVDSWINPHNQLPPVVQVVMVAIDEVSAQRLEDAYADKDDLNLSEILRDSAGKTLFTDPSKLDDDPTTSKAGDGDIAALEARLKSDTYRRLNIQYRIFASNVSLRGAKWSKAQTN